MYCTFICFTSVHYMIVCICSRHFGHDLPLLFSPPPRSSLPLPLPSPPSLPPFSLSLAMGIVPCYPWEWPCGSGHVLVHHPLCGCGNVGGRGGAYMWGVTLGDLHGGGGGACGGTGVVPTTGVLITQRMFACLQMVCGAQAWGLVRVGEGWEIR